MKCTRCKRPHSAYVSRNDGTAEYRLGWQMLAVTEDGDLICGGRHGASPGTLYHAQLLGATVTDTDMRTFSVCVACGYIFELDVWNNGFDTAWCYLCEGSGLTIHDRIQRQKLDDMQEGSIVPRSAGRRRHATQTAKPRVTM